MTYYFADIGPSRLVGASPIERQGMVRDIATKNVEAKEGFKRLKTTYKGWLMVLPIFLLLKTFPGVIVQYRRSIEAFWEATPQSGSRCYVLSWAHGLVQSDSYFCIIYMYYKFRSFIFWPLDVLKTRCFQILGTLKAYGFSFPSRHQLYIKKTFCRHVCACDVLCAWMDTYMCFLLWYFICDKKIKMNI